MKYSFFIIFIYFGIITNLNAQNYVNIFNIGSCYSPYNKFKHFDNKVSINESFANLKIPVLLKNKNVFIFGLSINSLLFDNQPEISNNEKYYTSSLQMGYTKNWNEKFSTMLVVLPKISSDFKDISKEDYQIGGLLVFTIKKQENLKYKFGVYYNREYFGPFIVPLLGIDWQPNDNIQLFGNLPINLTLAVKLNNKLTTGLFFQAPAGSYRLGEENLSAYLQKTTQELSLFFDSYFTKNIVMTIKGGYTLGRSYRLYSNNDKLNMKLSAFNFGNERNQLNEDFNDGFIFELKLSYRLSTNNDNNK